MTAKAIQSQPFQLAQAVVPGPCPPEGCPPPTEIVCIEVEKVYDFCFQTESRDVCDLVDAGLTPTPTPLPVIDFTQPVTITCSVTSFSCSELARTPVAGANPGIQSVTLRICFAVTMTITQGTTTITHTTPITCFTKNIVLCAPTGTTVDCMTHTRATCGPCFVASVNPATPQVATLCCEVEFCLIVQSTATVKLLVPSYGFCVPVECVPIPKLPCPPTDLFPPQCVPPAPTTP
ncbi:MAG: hypothetical protein IRY95_01970 [Clostridia bacterium]|nr:hypothetical protein [Clostridia bacterium]